MRQSQSGERELSFPERRMPTLAAGRERICTEVRLSGQWEPEPGAYPQRLQMEQKLPGKIGVGLQSVLVWDPPEANPATKT